MNEAKCNTLLSHWVAKNKDKFESFLVEGKFCNLAKKKSVGLYDFEDHQLPLLRKVATGVWHKFPDLGYRTPCDAVYIKGDGWVALYWYIPRKQKLCTMIHIRDFDRFFKYGSKKSIKQEDAERIASHVFDL